MLQYTGHPLVDVGVATITAFSNKKEPADVTLNDLREFADFMEGVYFGGRWKGMMAISFMNSPYTQPNIGEEKKKKHREEFILGFQRKNTGSERCAFCSRFTSTKAFRQHIPLLTGEGVVNFFPWGQAGLPVCGYCSLAIQGFLLGSVNCKGRILLVHSDDNRLTFEFARRFLIENRRFLSLANITQEDEKAQNVEYLRTYFMVRLNEIEQERREKEAFDQAPCSVTVYHMTNYGTNPDVAIYHLPYQLVAFIRRANQAPHGQVWRKIEQRAWELDIKTKRQQGSALDGANNQPYDSLDPKRVRNYLYEDLFELPQNAGAFIRTYFLRRAYRTQSGEDPRKDYSLKRELDLVSWDLTQIFSKGGFEYGVTSD